MYSFLTTTLPRLPFFIFFFFNDTATTEIYTLSLHDALPISEPFVEPTIKAILSSARTGQVGDGKIFVQPLERVIRIDRKSTRLNSSHLVISYAVFCLKKKKKKKIVVTKMSNVITYTIE